MQFQTANIFLMKLFKKNTAEYIRGLGFCLALLSFFVVPFNAYASDDEDTVVYDSAVLFSEEGIALYADDEPNHFVLYQQISELYHTIVAFQDNVDGYYSAMWNKISTERATITGDNASRFSTLTKHIDDEFESLSSTLSNYYGNLWEKITNERAAITGDNASRFSTLTSYIDEQFTALSSNMQKQSSDIQSNASQNSQNEIDNANKNQEEIMNGDKEYEEYEFSSGLTDVLVKIEEYCDSLDNTLVQIDSAADVASSYIQQGTSVIDGVFGVLPTAVIALITFGIVFIFARKVVGR